MNIILIWIKDDTGIWLHDAWDELSIEENRESFDAKLLKLAKGHTLRGDEGVVRLQKATLPEGTVSALFDTPIVELDLSNHPTSSIAAPTPPGEE